MKSEPRYLSDLKDVICDQAWLKTAKDFKVYSIRRDIKTIKCPPARVGPGAKAPRGLRYDETIIYPKMLGKEFPKTKGHDHPKSCSEWLTVVKGKAVFFLQNAKGKIVKDAHFVKADKGDWVFSPKGFGHVTINPTKRPLKIGTLIDPNCQGSYKEIEKLGGACYYYTIKGWLPNKNYPKAPKLREEKPRSKPDF